MDTTLLKTLDERTHEPVETRMESAQDTRARVDSFIHADNNGPGMSRSRKRAIVKGLVDGNPPYSHAKQVEAGRADMCNVNWRMAKAYLAAAWGAIYDLFSEASTYAVCFTEAGKGQQQADWNAIITEGFDLALKEDRWLDYEMQNSIYDMVLYFCGPLMFNGTLDHRPRYQPCQYFLLPEMAKSKNEEWEEAALRSYLTPHDLYSKIKDPISARAAGWFPEAVRKSIMFSHPKSREAGQYANWEWHQQKIKNSSYWYSAEAAAIHTAHYFFREFPQKQEEMGRITHCIVDLSTDGQEEYLYRHVRRFKSFDEIIHPMYYDNLGGGYHHSIAGMGIEMYAAIAYQNKLICNLADKTFAPKMLFKPTTANAEEQFNLASFGDYARIPAGYDFVQVPFQGVLEDGINFNREVSNIVSSNLSQYRPELKKEGGNPATATEVKYDAQQEARVAKTQLNHYYNQLDWMYGEIFRRITNLNLPGGLPGSAIAKRFQKYCKDRNVPPIALRKARAVASRVIGQGNQFLRQQTLMNLMGLVARLPQSGQDKLVRDYIAAQGGYLLVNRYFPEREQGNLPTDHEMLATLQIAAAKNGVAPVLTESQNHVIYAQAFLHAAASAAGSLQQGADPHGVAQFLETIGPAIHAHLQTFANDPTREVIYKQLSSQFAKLQQTTDRIHQQIAKMDQAKQAEMQKQQQAQQALLSEEALKAREVDGKLALSQTKADRQAALKARTTDFNLNLKAQQHAQDLALADASTAAEIRRKHAAVANAPKKESE